jgi:transcriptional regulator with GAF, ATPase, and Fis domain
MTETIPAMRDRQSLELVAAVTAQLDSGVSQAEAARRLGVSHTHLHNIIKRNAIDWPDSRQAAPIHTRETAQ